MIDLMKEIGFALAKARSRRYLAQTIADADYADDIANTPTWAESVLHCLERVAGGVGLHVNAGSSCAFNQEVISPK